MPLELKGARVVVTGASSGIGEAVATRLAAMGAKVTVTGRRQEGLDVLVADHDHREVGVGADKAGADGVSGALQGRVCRCERLLVGGAARVGLYRVVEGLHDLGLGHGPFEGGLAEAGGGDQQYESNDSEWRTDP